MFLYFPVLTRHSLISQTAFPQISRPLFPAVISWTCTTLVSWQIRQKIDFLQNFETFDLIWHYIKGEKERKGIWEKREMKVFGDTLCIIFLFFITATKKKRCSVPHVIKNSKKMVWSNHTFPAERRSKKPLCFVKIKSSAATMRWSMKIFSIILNLTAITTPVGIAFMDARKFFLELQLVGIWIFLATSCKKSVHFVARR